MNWVAKTVARVSTVCGAFTLNSSQPIPYISRAAGTAICLIVAPVAGDLVKNPQLLASCLHRVPARSILVPFLAELDGPLVETLQRAMARVGIAGARPEQSEKRIGPAVELGDLQT